MAMADEITIGAIRKWDPGTIGDVFGLSKKVADHAESTSIQLKGLSAFEHWTGSAAEEANDAVRRTRIDLGQLSDHTSNLADAARRAEHEVIDVKAGLQRLMDEADSYGFQISDDDTIRPLRPSLDMTDAEEADYNRKLNDLSARMGRLLTEAKRVDRDLANAIKEAGAPKYGAARRLIDDDGLEGEGGDALKHHHRLEIHSPSLGGHHEEPDGSEIVTPGVGGGRPNQGADRGDGRDNLGQYARGNDGRSGKNAEKVALDKYESQNPGVKVVRDQRLAQIPNARGVSQNGRYYDGLVKNSDGTYTGIEVKSGTASLTPGQRSFDGAVNGGQPAYVKLPDGTTGKIVRVKILKE
ncbi:hypothetical protein HUN08_17765 [Gordonia sp. X0973]|uniref:hypothetical protein n=1 Tax=Gordonia sp. X0973 TaxID=2742602 RepID=UPI000F5238F3|nr:hypothetical protein [Gordonia sp. X0973]QKT08849.1 hypothetical protein HUN08_17765 [Gordonia sp. X0973]